MRPNFDGVLFFPVTPFVPSGPEEGSVDLDALARHIAKGVDAGPGGVFAACGTGEFHAMEVNEFGHVVRTAV
ncbi:5-dehydro-4-deoxyglucarate dehydratase, partial [Mycobacterium sp. ITM-2017-0098]